MNTTIALIPIGPVPSDLVTWLADRLKEMFARGVAVGDTIPLPPASYNTDRRQYRGDAFIAALTALPLSDAERLVGITDVDCFARGLNFIFGQARLNAREAFVALPRLRQSFYGLPEDPALFRQRALKEVIHELGHTWDLSHCPDPRCVMHFSNSLHNTDVKGTDFCPQCQRKLPRIG